MDIRRSGCGGKRSVADAVRRLAVWTGAIALFLPVALTFGAPPPPLIIGGDQNYPPFEFIDVDGRPSGLAVDLTKAIARELDLDVRIRLGPWNTIVDALQAGEIDAIQGIFHTDERARTMRFSPPYLVAHYVPVVHRDHGRPPRTFDDLRDLRLVVQTGDVIWEMIEREQLADRTLTVDDQEDALRMVLDGQADCALTMRSGALMLIERNGWPELTVGSRSFFHGDYGYAVAIGREDLLAHLREGLQAVRNSGEYRRIHNQWLGVYPDPRTPFSSVLKSIAVIVFSLLAIILLCFVWVRSLRRQVARRTSELRHQEKFVRKVLDNLPVGVAVNSVKPDVKFTYMNDLFPAFYRTSRKALDRGDFWEVVYPDPRFREEIRQQVLADCATGDPDCMVWTDVPITRDGETTTYITARNTPIPGTELMISSVWDVSERKRNEERVVHLNQVLRAIRDVNQLIVRETDRNVLLQHACDILVATRGYRSAWIAMDDGDEGLEAVAEAGMGEGFAAFAVEIRQGAWPTCCRRAMAQGDVIRLYDTDKNCVSCPLAGRYRDNAALASPLRHGDRTFGVLVVALPASMAGDKEEQALFKELAGDLGFALHNIEQARQRRQAEAALRDSEARFRSLAEAAPVGIVILDSDGKTLYLNRYFRERFGYTIDDLPDIEAWWSRAYADDEIREIARRRCLAALESARRTGDPVPPEEFPVYCKDGKVRQIEFRLAIRSDMLFVVMADLTERRQAESQLLQAQKMESVARLAGGVAHDFNNLLMGIMNYVELCRDEITDDHPIREWLDEIKQGAERSAALTRQLLAFARRQTIVPRILDLNAAVDGMVNMLRRLIGEDIDLAWEPDSRLWPVKMDSSQIDQVLANLCVNARDAIHGVGKVTIKTANQSFDETYCSTHDGYHVGDYAMLAVSDDGDGMDREILDHLFEPFFTTKPVGEGTGLGLPTVYGIVKQNQGFINVYSKPGRGTTFRFYLPRQQAQPPEQAAPTWSSTQTGGAETVLLVEDEPAIRTTIRIFLEKLGYTVLEGKTPQAALEIAADGRSIHLLITDVVMPGMNGRDLAARLTAERPSLKVLYMSGYTANVIVHRGILDKGMHFLAKPVMRDELAAKIRDVLDEKRA